MMIRQNPAYVLRTIDELHILVSCRKNEIGKWLIFLNDTAAYIWDHITVLGMERDQILCDLKDQYQFSNTGAEEDAVNTFIDQMIQQKIFLKEHMDD